MQPVNLSPDALFFHEHAAYSYPAGTRDPEPHRTANAIGLANAETMLRHARYSLDLCISWEIDQDAMSDARVDGDDSDTTYYACTLLLDGIVVASLGGIDVCQPHPYARVVEAEMAREAEDTILMALSSHNQRYASTCNCARRLALRRGA